MERDDAVTKFEENARASGALLKQVNNLELLNENLRRDLNEAKEVSFECLNGREDYGCITIHSKSIMYQYRVISRQLLLVIKIGIKVNFLNMLNFYKTVYLLCLNHNYETRNNQLCLR